ncbi:MAG: transglycosylase domain-containing protein [Clostridia bacterium]
MYNKYDLDTIRLTSVNNGIQVYSSSGVDSTLYNTDRSIIKIDTLPDYVLDAFISTEDKHFYSHKGYDLGRILKASIINLSTRSKSQGASTISQQLIKNALLTNEKTYSRKIKEIILSIKMEKSFTKDEILEMYLNTIYFGANAYGIENASKIYFNKSAKDLTLNEACCLAGIIKSPNHYSPRNNYHRSLDRKNLVAKMMYDNDYITKEEYSNVLNMPIEVSSNLNFDYSYEVEAIHEACDLLGISERELINNKYQIITFKNDSIQQKIIDSTSDVLSNTLEDDLSLDSLSIITNTNGQIIAYYANSPYDLHNISRQPASTLKPLAVYLPAIEHNILSPASMILDEEINYNGFSPKNAQGKYHGYISTRQAISESLNIPAVKTLEYVGFNKSRDTLSNLGIEITNSDMNLTLALGSIKNGVKPITLLSAYNTLANLGTYHNLTFVDKILDENNNIIYSYEDYSKDVIDKASAFLITDMLKDTATTGTARRLAELNLPIASKTGTAGTSTINTDLYNISYTTDHTMLTWIANLKDNRLPSTLHSSNQPTEINKRVLSSIYAQYTPEDFKAPDNVSRLPYDIVALENDHTLISPNNLSDRYIGYDYFKLDNAPKIIDNSSKIDFSIALDRSGASINLTTKRNKIYNIIREKSKSSHLLDQIKDTDGEIIIKDHDVFQYDELSYYIADQDNQIISEIKKIRPKDYLVSLFTNNILNNKKRWYI